MALTLKTAITATATTIDVNGTDELSNGDLLAIEDEQVLLITATTGSVQPGETAWQRLGVDRGVLGTDEVAHAAGTSVTAVTTPLGAGGVQTVRLLGPYTITPATTNLVDPADNGALIESLTAGTLVRVLTFNRTVWDSTDPELDVVLAEAVDGTASTLAVVALGGTPNGAAIGLLAEASDFAAQANLFGFCEVACNVYVAAYPASGTITVGESDIYLLIAEPSA